MAPSEHPAAQAPATHLSIEQWAQALALGGAPGAAASFSAVLGALPALGVAAVPSSAEATSAEATSAETTSAETTSATITSAETTSATLRVAFAKLGRLVPHVALQREPLEGVLRASGLDTDLVAALTATPFSSADVLARVAFLQVVSDRLPGAQLEATLTTLYRTASSREQASIMRAIGLLPEPQRFVPLVREAARTNDIQVFTALCHDNPFLCAALPDDALFQVVLKSLFLGVGAARIVRLEPRVTPELVRMLGDYEKERLAAGRPVPADVARIAQSYDSQRLSSVAVETQKK